MSDFAEVWPNGAPVRVSLIDVEAIESAAETLLRLRRTQEAVGLFALALRLRRDLGLLPGKERRCEPVT